MDTQPVLPLYVTLDQPPEVLFTVTALPLGMVNIIPFLVDAPLLILRFTVVVVWLVVGAVGVVGAGDVGGAGVEVTLL